ncbi:MAG TPA: rhodanese-like domain-containing protein [Thermoanaerobaculia bacterium]
MNWRKHFLEAATLVVAAVVCALVSNAMASRERKLVVAPAQPAGGGQRAAGGPATTQPAGGGQRVAGGPPTTDNRPPTTTTTREPRTAKREPRPTTRQFTPHPDKAYVEIHGDDVAALHKQGALFLDARRTSVYEQGHIPGARPFSVWESDIDEKVNKLFAERSDPRDQNLPIVIYCSGGDCEDSHMLAQKLWGIQFNNIYVYKDGFPDWQSRGEPIRTGSTP